MIRGGEKRTKRREEREGEYAGAWAPKAFCSPFTARRSRTRKIRGVRERTRRGARREPRVVGARTTGGAGAGAGAGAGRENEKDQRGQERNEYHCQAILVALQTGKTTRNSVSETRPPLLAEDEFRSFCSARERPQNSSVHDSRLFVRRVCPPAFWISLAIEVSRELRTRVDARTIFFCITFDAIQPISLSYKTFAQREE